MNVAFLDLIYVCIRNIYRYTCMHTSASVRACMYIYFLSLIECIFFNLINNLTRLILCNKRN